MIRRSYSLGALALGLSGALHLAGLSAVPSQTVRIEGGAQQQEVRLGNSFQDVAEGVLTAAAPEALLDPPEPEPLAATEPPKALERAAPVTPAIAPPVTPSAAVTPALRTEPLKPVDPAAAETVPSAATAALAPLEPLPTPDPLSPVALPTPRAEVIEAAPDAESAVPQVSRRPSLRPKAVEEAAAKAQPKPKTAAKAQKKKPKKTAKKREPQKAKTGRTASSQRKGKASGTKQGKASRTSSGKAKNRKAGNAKASNYPGLVARKIRRSRKPRVKGRGRVVVRFRVSSSGGIASIGVAKSSGNASVDKAAVQYIRRAAPFPRPPQGAQRSFNQAVSFK